MPSGSTPSGNLDGVEPDGKGGYYVTDSFAGKLLEIDKEGAVRVVLEGFKGPADFAYLSDKTLLILPRIGENTVTAYDLSKIR